jgi:DNA glycosylase AlkZ-like
MVVTGPPSHAFQTIDCAEGPPPHVLTNPPARPAALRPGLVSDAEFKAGNDGVAEGEPDFRVTSEQAAAFRLSRHHLARRRPRRGMLSAVADICGAQAQVLRAAEISVWARVKGARLKDVERELWQKRSLARAWCMRGTMFLLPSAELAVFARGTSLRASYNYRYSLSRVGSRQALDRALDGVVGALDVPLTRNGIADRICRSTGFRQKLKPGGGWGDGRPVPWVEIGKGSLPVGFLLHTVGVREVICSGPGEGAEATYVRAAKWLPGWREVPVESGEDELLMRYMKAFGPASLGDFALWMGVYVRDAKPIWARAAARLARVEVGGEEKWLLDSDSTELERAERDGESLKLLPYFDSFLLGHKSHRNIVAEQDHGKVYRPQGWVSPVVLIGGKARGVWGYTQRKGRLEVKVRAFSKLPASAKALVSEEASGLARFLGASGAEVSFD